MEEDITLPLTADTGVIDLSLMGVDDLNRIGFEDEENSES